MAAITPSPDSTPSVVPPPLGTTPPPSPSTVVTPPPITASPPLPSNPPPDNSGPPPVIPPPPVESSPPPTTTAPPPPVESSPPPTTPAPPPPVKSSPPPTTSAPPPTPLVSPPSIPITPQTPPPVASSPPVPSVSPPPPQKDPPPLSSPPPQSAPPPSPLPVSSPPPQSSPPPSPPVGSRPPPASPPPRASSPPPSPPPSSAPPPESSHTPPSSNPPTVSPPPPQLSPNPPVRSPPPPPPSSSNPPESSPPPPAFTPPRKPPPPPAAQPPHAPPSRPAAAPPPPPPNASPPSSSEFPPPSDPSLVPPPFVSPGTLTPVVEIPPSSSHSPPSPSKTVPASPSLPSNKSGVAPDTANNASSNGGIGSGGAIAIGVITGVLVLGLIGLIALCMFKRKKRSSGDNDGHIIPASMGSSPRPDINLLIKTEDPASHPGGSSGADTPTDPGRFGHSRSWFTYQELSEATGGFSDENLLGEGGFGCVYKGHLVDGRVVAVKQLKIGGGQGEREFKAEVEIISRIHHRHLVSLVGYCIWESKRLLVYDYVPNNTLYFHLHAEARPVMGWAIRVKIAVGAARGITYLHEDCHPRIIHRDIKSSNILIDNNYEAQVSDFGLAKLAMDADTHISTRVVGTFGYMAPEYATTGKLTEKSDVYSFGVVLLELITGRKPVDGSQPLGDESLVEWARPLLAHTLETGEYDSLVDPHLEKNYIESEMLRMIQAAAACVRHSSSRRPRMGQVVRALGEADSEDLSNGLKVGESQLYNSAQQSADIRWFRRMAFGSPDSISDPFSQPTQSSDIQTHSRQDMYFSAQPVRDGDSRLHTQESQSLSLLGHPETIQDSDVNISRRSNENVQGRGLKELDCQTSAPSSWPRGNSL